MPVHILSKDPIFPSPEDAEENGLLAVGGDLTKERLLAAYALGVFPWYTKGSPLLWWSPDPRLILFPGEISVSRSLKQTVRKGVYTITMDKAFGNVIRACATVSGRREEGTWITPEMINAYTELHTSGYAHSVESWYDNKLVGGLYGVALGGAFFGESMFSRMPDASKAAFVGLTEQLKAWDFRFIDCQITTRHLLSFGAREISRKEFLTLLQDALKIPFRSGLWSFDS